MDKLAVHAELQKMKRINNPMPELRQTASLNFYRTIKLVITKKRLQYEK